MAIGDPKHALGMGHGSGSPALTGLGNVLKGAAQKHELRSPNAPKTYMGWLKDIRLPLGDNDVKNDNLPGIWVKIYFDSKTLNRIWGNTWFRLKEHPANLLQNYGTEDSIRAAKIRLQIIIYSVNVRAAVVTIVGDAKNERTHREFEKTPVMCFLDLINGLGSGSLP